MRRTITAAPRLLLFFALHANALDVDTVIVADGSPGPYPLGRLFVNASTLRVTFADSTAGLVPPYTYVDDVNGVMFSEPIDSAALLRVRYSTSFYGLAKTYSLYRRYAVDTSDTSTLPRLGREAGFGPLAGDERLDVSGYKSVGVSVGNLGQMNLEQALEVRIFGDIAPETELSANLSDQGTSIEGDTREIGEIDMVYIALTNPRYNAVVGDQYVDLLPGGILYEKKKIKGISAAFTPGAVSAAAFGAIAGGKYAIETMRGRQGFQGPYYLSGNGEPDLITPVSSTVKVSVDGRECAEGEDEDYTVDYDLGAVRFTPRFAISDDQVIRIEYEYKTFDYQRLFFGSKTQAANTDSTVSARGVIWYETDNRNNPIEIDLSGGIRDSLRNAGDNPPPFSTAREVHPNDVASHSQLYPLYRQVVDSVSGGRVYVYTPYDPLNPFNNKGYYYVWFRDAGAGSGDYLPDSADYRGMRYRYAGPGLGTHTPSSPVPAPQRTITGEMAARIVPRPWLALSVDVAGEERDKNLFSTLDDNDNAASATRSSVLAGRKSRDERCLWTGGNHTFISRRFSREVISFYERKTVWGRERDLNLAGDAQHAWEGFAGATVFPGVSTQFSYGQYVRNDTLLTHRAANESSLGLGRHTVVGYTGDFIRHTDRVELPFQQHNRLSIDLDFDRIGCGALADNERESNGADTVRGYVGAGADFTVKPINLSEQVYYSRQLSGTDLLVTAPDTGSYFVWSQRVRHSPLDGWTLSGTSSYQHRVRRDDTLATTLVTAGNEVVSARAGFSTRQRYSVSSERASAFVQVPVFAGTGQGMYSLDTTTSELAPDPFGSYYVYEQEVLDRSGDRRVRKTSLEGDWSFKPPVTRPRGFLADVTWSASFGVREHLQSDGRLRAGGWVPGYYALGLNRTGKIQYANMYYRQAADWRPRDSGARARAGLHARPSYSLVRRIEEREMEWGADAERAWSKFLLQASGRVLDIRRFGVAGPADRRDTVADQSASLLEQYEIGGNLFVFVKETTGRAGNDRSARRWGPYLIGQPGVRFQPRERGFAEASYTISWVDVDGTLDWRMAQGHSAGLSHTISAFADIRIGENFSVGGNYRGEFNRPKGTSSFGPGVHVVTVEVKAYL
jgi:hypothetical protein